MFANFLKVMQLCYKFNLMKEHPLVLNIYLLDSAQIEFDRIESRIPEIKNDKDDFTFIDITHYSSSTNNIIFHLDSLSKSKKPSAP